MMRKLFAIILAVMISVCMAVTASAVTPTIKVHGVRCYQLLYDR